METTKESAVNQYNNNGGNENCDLPIRSRECNRMNEDQYENMGYVQNPNMIEVSSFIRQNRKRKFFAYKNETTTEMDDIFPQFRNLLDMSSTENKLEEVLKSAKSLFYKRTSTLYHWMYPNFPKKMIKEVITNIWEDLGIQEKQHYVSEVLTKFGYPKFYLMVNPQIGGLKDIFSLSGEKINKLNTVQRTSASSTTNPPSKHRKGRPPGSKNKKKKAKTDFLNEFQDDPELKQELEIFVRTYDGFK